MNKTLVLRGVVAVMLALAACSEPESTACKDGDFVATEADFTCLLDWESVGRLRFRNACGQRADTQRMLTDRQPGQQFPVGTIIQLQPLEAMVKRRLGFDPPNQDWEYFKLGGSPAGTSIKERGTTLTNDVGSCRDCHAGGKEYDFVCQEGHGCDPLPVPNAVLASGQYRDVRCLPP